MRTSYTTVSSSKPTLLSTRDHPGSISDARKCLQAKRRTEIAMWIDIMRWMQNLMGENEGSRHGLHLEDLPTSSSFIISFDDLERIAGKAFTS
jgi:hypothetical protein